MDFFKTPCNRCVKRVPMDFQWSGIWKGYLPTVERLRMIPELVMRAPYLETDGFGREMDTCRLCNAYSGGKCVEDAAYCVIHNSRNRALWYQEPPWGEGYQLWETTSEGSPISPVFKTLEELCGWAAEHTTTFGGQKRSREEWKEILQLPGGDQGLRTSE